MVEISRVWQPCTHAFLPSDVTISTLPSRLQSQPTTKQSFSCASFLSKPKKTLFLPTPTPAQPTSQLADSEKHKPSRTSNVQNHQKHPLALPRHTRLPPAQQIQPQPRDAPPTLRQHVRQSRRLHPRLLWSSRGGQLKG
ncbi:hypothetical protein B0T14DRAFT_207891 [Immersiella caudata]|uniref:Uncharacterized protein n=1 Tax=Immersiella caudata TaxID=314043 RepID=A0AA40BZR2_9PEZI|nr:hypothetical protein B0T14DRAFT_207891 [Immersiella caudata]